MDFLNLTTEYQLHITQETGLFWELLPMTISIFETSPLPTHPYHHHDLN